MLPEPWLSFFQELDPIAGETTKIPCIGGFAVTQYYGSPRATIDVDVIDVAPMSARHRLMEAGGKGSALALKHRVYLDFVGVVQAPYDYEDRLIPVHEGLFRNIHLLVLDPYDIALCKLKRDIDRDFQDMLYLAQTTPFDLKLFEQRYREELRPYLFGDVREADHTFNAWLEAVAEERRNGDAPNRR